MFSWVIGHILAAGIGISLGLIGGGSILAVPILVYAIGVPPKSAIAPWSWNELLTENPVESPRVLTEG